MKEEKQQMESGIYKLSIPLFDSKGNLNPDGQWDLYFGANSNIRPFIFIPETQASVNNFVVFFLKGYSSKSE